MDIAILHFRMLVTIAASVFLLFEVRLHMLRQQAASSLAIDVRIQGWHHSIHKKVHMPWSTILTINPIPSDSL